MGNEIKGYGWREVVKRDFNRYRPQSSKIKSGLFVRAEIKNHVEKYGVDLSCCQPEDAGEYETFSDYLSRSFAEGARRIDDNPNSLIAPCDGYITVHFINSMCMIPVGDHMYSVDKLLDSDSRAKEFAEGLVLVVRPGEADPHRFVYVDSGMVSDTAVVPAERNMEDSMFFGPRNCTFMNTTHFHGIAQVETCGNAKGVEQFALGESPVFAKGQDKGRFLCGGAGIMILFKKGVMFPDDEIMVNTRMGLETRVHMGEKIGVAIAAG